MAEAISVKQVKKQFLQGGETTYALKGVDFNAHFGELVMIVGPSGSGKTTLLSVIAGTLKCDAGSISVLDTCIDRLSDDQMTSFRREHIGFIFQQYHLIPALTCAENVSIPLLLNGWKSAAALEKAKAALDEVGLAAKINASPKKLSGGQQQRVAIARALIHDPKLIICDEPTSALDAETGAKIMEMISKQAKSKEKSKERVVVVVTHDSRTFRFADRVVEMEDGQIYNTVQNHHA